MNSKNRIGLIFLSLIVIFISSAIVTNKKMNFQSNLKNDKAQVIAESSDQNLKPTESLPQTKAIATIKQNKQVRNSKVNVGIVVDDYSNKTGAISSLEKSLGIKFTTIAIYKQFGNPTNKDINLSDLAYIKQNNKTLMITWEPWNPSEGTNQSKDYLNEINSGAMDAYINQFATGIKSYGGHVVIRFGHEMNGNWYPWASRSNDYKKAYVRIVESFRKLGVNNAEFCWSVNFENVPFSQFAQVSAYYPGSAYVDIIGIDGFNWGSVRPSGWKSFSDIFSAPYNYLYSTYKKPITITETASSEEGGSKPEWISSMFSELNSNFLNISELVWFNLLKESDWRIESSKASLTSFKNSY